MTENLHAAADPDTPRGGDFRGKFLDLTRRAFADGKLSFSSLTKLEDADAFAAQLKKSY